jgi:peptidoglycan hydrolase CwlO-like protein
MDTTKRKEIEARSEAARASGEADKKALGKDVQEVLGELDKVAKRREDLEHQVSERDREIARLKDELKALE